MKGITLRFLNNDDLIDYNEQDSLIFIEQFNKKEVNHNIHYFNRDKNTIIQVNDDFSVIDCPEILEESQIAAPTQGELLEMIKKIVLSGASFYISTLHAELDELLSVNNLFTLEEGVDTNESYLARLEEYFDDVFKDFYAITITSPNSRVYFYKIGTIAFHTTTHDLNILEDSEVVVNYLSSFKPILKDINKLEEVVMIENRIKNNTLGDLW